MSVLRSASCIARAAAKASVAPARVAVPVASTRNMSTSKPPVKVAITGSAGQIGYATLFRIASGAMLGPDQPIILHCIELPHALNALKGVAMELEDCAFPLLRGIVATDNIEKGFEDVDYALLVGAKPRGKGQERQDLLKDNGKIFTAQGKALNKFAKKTARIIVVGNPANTNCLIAASNAPNIPAENFTAMTRLDHNRAIAQVVNRVGCQVSDVEKVAIWGNHSATQYPDLSYATIKGKSAKQVINNQQWIENEFIPIVQKRGAAVIEARGSSSAASAGNAAIDHMRDWALGTKGQWVSMAIPSDGSYGVPKGVYFSYPVVCANGKYEKVANLPIDEFSAKKIEITKKELLEERDMVKDLLA